MVVLSILSHLLSKYIFLLHCITTTRVHVLHLHDIDEGHVTVNGRVASASIFDFGLYFFHNVSNLLHSNTGPYFYLPKLETHIEARLWNDVFVAAQKYLGIPIGTIRATVLLETITAAFVMEEILFELRHHSVGLNCGAFFDIRI